MFSRYFIKPKEECPCGSSKRYIDCCFKKNDINIPEKKREYYPTEVLLSSIYETCLHPDKSTCTKKIKKAHALQNNRILSKLSRDNHVVIMNYKKKPLNIKLDNGEKLLIKIFELEGVNRATRYPCFCYKHDDEVFADIEKSGCDFVPGNKKQEFLYAYKAFAFEYYKHTVEIKQFQRIAKDLPSSLKDPVNVQKYRVLQSRLRDLEYYKTKFDNDLLTENYKNIETVVIELDNVINFANFSCFCPRYDLHGKRIKAFNRGEKITSKVFATIFPDELKSYILISYYRDDYKYFKHFINQLSSEDHNLIRFYFNSIIPIYSDNIVINPRLWDSWNEDIQIAFTYYNNLNGQEWIMDKAISFGLKNHRKYSNMKVDYTSSRINMF